MRAKDDAVAQGVAAQGERGEKMAMLGHRGLRILGKPRRVIAAEWSKNVIPQSGLRLISVVARGNVAPAQPKLCVVQGLGDIPAGNGFGFQELFQAPDPAFAGTARRFHAAKKGPCPA